MAQDYHGVKYLDLKNNVSSDNINFYAIYLSKEEWNKHLNSWLVDCQNIQTIRFN